MSEEEKILISGSTGFIGSHLIPQLVKAGYDVWVLCRYVTGRYVLGENVKTVFADIKDYSAVERAVKLVHPDRVIHLAAISPVSYSYDHPQEVTRINYLGLINLAEACRLNVENMRQFVSAGTSEEYGNQKDFPINEEARLYPNSPYAVSKVACTKYLEFMRDAYDFPMTVIRPFNTYGRKMNMHFVIERIITQMLSETEEIKLGDPEPIRDFVYVDDHVNAYMKAISKKKAIGEIFNVATSEGTSIEKLANMIKDLTDFKGDISWHMIPVRPLDINTLIGDANKASMMIGWLPKHSLRRGLQKTVDYWKNILTQTPPS